MNAKSLTYVIDIDGTICTQDGDHYSQATPILSTIRTINHLFDLGHQIILFTARGSTTGIDWSSLTKKQLEDWGIRYHQLIFGKPFADYYVDDKNMSIAEFVNQVEVRSC
jgi:histidinol phosphatase-like enzyme